MDFEQMKKIVDGAPDGATHYHRVFGKVDYTKKDGRDYYWWDFRTGNWYKDLDISDKDLIALN